MSASYYRRDTCRLCESQDLELIMRPVPTPPGDHYIPVERLSEVQEVYPLDLFYCKTCGNLQLSDVVDPAILYGNYIYTTSISLGLVEHFRQYALKVLDYIKPAQGALVIDIGSNDGTILRHFKAEGMQVLGVEPAGHIAQKACEAGVETLAAFFSGEIADKIQREYDSAAIITANNVFANIDDLAAIIAGIRKLLSPDGVFVVETGYMVDLIKNDLFDNIYHEHISYFGVRPLQNFFSRQGMEMIHAEHIPTKGGSIRCIAQLKGGPRPISPSVPAMVDYELSLGMDGVEPFNRFADNIENIKNRLLDRLKGLKAEGKSIAGYGASVGVTTLLYHFELSNLLDFMVDDNPVRHNLYTPGHHIPVLPSQAIYDRNPDYVLILAWRYADPIMNKHQVYLAQGGHFILPLPDIKTF